ncbi:cell wall hydrolase, partial [Phocaeicola vulgatus]
EKVQDVKGLKGKISTREKAILTRIVEAEATDKDMKSKILVANVILNRVRSKEFPNTIEQVVFQRTNGSVQFSP